jgi:transposase
MMMGVLTLPIGKTSTLSDATFARPDLTTFCRLDELELDVVGQRLEPDRAVLACRVVEPDRWCRRCGCQGVPRDSVFRRLAHEPLGWRPTTLLVTIRRYRCPGCGHVWRVEGRSQQALRQWFAAREQAWRDQVEVVAMDGFTGFKTAATAELPDAVAVMDPFHVMRLAGEALDQCRRRIQQNIHGYRGRKHDPLYSARRTLHTGADLLTDKQRARLIDLFAADEHVQVEATWGIYQRMIAAYREPDRARGQQLMTALIDAVSQGVPAALREVVTLGRTLKKRAVDVLAYFERPGTSNGPTEAINGRIEHLRGSALAFRNLTNYIARALLETGGFRPHLHPQL